MKDINIKEFLKEVEYIEQTKDMLNAENSCVHSELAKVVGELEAKLEAEKARADKAEKVVKTTREAYKKSIASKSKLSEKLFKAEAKLKELQPFERGVEGWGYLKACGWVEGKFLYHQRFKGSHYAVDKYDPQRDNSTNPPTRRFDDFTTENPHKKKTVCHGAWSWTEGCFVENDSFEEKASNADKVILNHHYKDKKGSCILVCNGNEDVFMFQVEIGTDLQAKFDDPNNHKYKDLTK